MKELLKKAFEAGKDKQYDIEWQMGKSKPDFEEWYNEPENQALILPDVVSSFFTASDVGKKFEIAANTSGHGFNIGEIVTLLETNAGPDDDEYKFAGKDDYWWCNFADIKNK